MVSSRDRDHRTTHSEEAGREIDILDVQLGEVAPPQPGLDVGLHQKLRVGARQGRVDVIELLGGDDSARLPWDRIGRDATAEMHHDHAVVERRREDRVEDGALAVLDPARGDVPSLHAVIHSRTCASPISRIFIGPKNHMMCRSIAEVKSCRVDSPIRWFGSRPRRSAGTSAVPGRDHSADQRVRSPRPPATLCPRRP
jgi:hypothetical protein